MDFKGWVTLGHRAALPSADHRRRPFALSFCLKACANQQGETVRGHLESTFRRYGLPEAIFVDNGSPWGDGSGERWTGLGVWLLKLGVESDPRRPVHPQSRGKNERFHRTLKAEVFALRRFPSFATCSAPSTPGATSTISSDRTRRSDWPCRPAVTGQARGQCPERFRQSTTTGAR